MLPRAVLALLASAFALAVMLAGAARAQTGYTAPDSSGNADVRRKVEKSLIIENGSNSTWTFILKPFDALEGKPGTLEVSEYAPVSDRLVTKATLTDEGSVTIAPAAGGKSCLVILSPVPTRDAKYYLLPGWLAKLFKTRVREDFLRECALDDGSGHSYGQVGLDLFRDDEVTKTPYLTPSAGDSARFTMPKAECWRLKGVLEITRDGEKGSLKLVIQKGADGTATLPPAPKQ